MTEPSDPSDFERAINELHEVQQDVINALTRAMKHVPHVKGSLPSEIITPLESLPIDQILADMLAATGRAEERALEDQERLAQFVVFLDRLNTQIEGMGMSQHNDVKEVLIDGLGDGVSDG